jgi:aspartate racemase
LEPGSATYNVAVATRLTGPLDLDALDRSLGAVVARHESLRTRFALHEGRPMQVVESDVEVPLRRLDFTSGTLDHREAEGRRAIAEEAERPFNLSEGPLIRALAVRLSPNDHIFLVTLHHIVSDGWSLDVLLRELAICYNAFVAGRPSPLEPLDIQYSDYSVWQQEWLQGAELERQLSYWRQQLAGVPVLQLQADRVRPTVLTSRGAEHPIAFSRGATDRLIALGRQERATLFMTLLAGFQTLLMRYTGQTDLAVGSPIAGRNRVEIEPLIGFFVNTLVLRTNLGGDPTFRELLQRVREVTLDAYTHQDIPFEKLVEDLRPERSTTHAPFCQAMLVLQNTPRSPFEFDRTTAVPHALVRSSAKFEISVLLRDGPAGLAGVIEYSTDLFAAARIAGLARHYERLLEGACVNPDSRLSELPLLDERERHQILVAWNRTGAAYPREHAVTQVFEAQADRSPNAVAIVSGAARITYAGLNELSNQIARFLRRQGIGRGARVALCLERSIEMVAAVLAVLKAGAAYVPLDPFDPPERLGLMIEDAAVAALFAQRKTASRLPAVNHVPVFVLDDEREKFARESAANLEDHPSAVDGAYVMYTSGSTGVPKAVTIAHRGIVRLVKGVSYVSLTSDDTVLQAAPLSFDASTFEIWGALLNGGTLAQVPMERASLAELGGVLERNRVTVAWFTSALFSQMVEHELGRLCQVRQVLAGGDVLSVPHVRRFLACATGSTLINGYGPTENTTFTCCHRLASDERIESSVPIGRPISNTEVFVLDPHLNPQPVGVPGELYAAGDGIAVGYWNRPELTAEQFVSNPFTNDPAGRMYRTGDRVRYRDDGTIEFLGRFDHQVKIRGYRVELAEIEAALAQHPAVSEAVVVVEQDADGNNRLDAYVAARSAVSGPELRHDIGSRLPEYMLPSSFTVLDTLPKTTAGKVDRQILTTLRTRSSEAHPGKPRNRIEEELAGLWREVLNVKAVGIHDNFFDLGGHSLLSTKIIARIRARYGVELPLRALFDAPTIAGLADRMLAPGPEPFDCLVALQPTGTKTPFFCIHGVGGEVQVYAELARLVDPERPFFGIRAPRSSDGRALTTVEALAALHVSDVRRVAPTGPYLLGGYSSGSTVAYEMAQQLTASGEQVLLVAALDARLPNLRPPRSSALAWLEAAMNFCWFVVDDLMEADRREVGARLRSKATLLAGKLADVPGLGWMRPERQTDVRDALGIPWVPKEFAALIEHHYWSYRAYQPRPYPGRVAVFRARTRPLLRLSESDLGWSLMARGGVEVHTVRGSHSNMLREPNVRHLADAMRKAFDDAERALVSDLRRERMDSPITPAESQSI